MRHTATLMSFSQPGTTSHDQQRLQGTCIIFTMRCEMRSNLVLVLSMSGCAYEVRQPNLKRYCKPIVP